MAYAHSPLMTLKQPRRKVGAQAVNAQDLADIIAYLQVEQAPRYKRTRSATFCNIYAHDYCFLASAYLPRVWWRAKAITQLLQGQAVKVRYGVTVEEYNVNSLFNWLEDSGLTLGGDARSA